MKIGQVVIFSRRDNRHDHFDDARLPSLSQSLRWVTMLMPVLFVSACTQPADIPNSSLQDHNTNSRLHIIKNGERGYELLAAVAEGRRSSKLPPLTEIESRSLSEVIRQFHVFVDRHNKDTHDNEPRVSNHRPRYGIYSQRIAHEQLHWSSPSLTGFYNLNLSDPFNVSYQREDNFALYERVVVDELKKSGNVTSFFHGNYFSPSYSVELSYAHVLRALLFVYQASTQGVPVLGFELPLSKLEYDRKRARIKNPHVPPLSTNEIQNIRWKDFPRSSAGTYHHNYLAFIDLANLLRALNLAVDVRFLSECEQPSSPYHPPKGASQFVEAFKEFKKATPPNVRFIFSPCAFSSSKVLGEFTNFGKAPFDYIGATVYSDTQMDVVKRYSGYYKFMTKLYPHSILRIDELGAPYADARAMMQFIDSSEKTYPKLKHICFFDGKLNDGSASQKLLGRYGIDFSKVLLR